MRAFAILAVEAFRDGLRRRLAFVVGIALLLGLASAQSCTQIGAGEFTLNEQQIDPHMVAGFVAPMLFAFQALTVLVIAGLVAADHLARPLAEGNAILWLARPVSREAWAGARLAGAMGIVLAAGAALLGGTGALLVLRQGVAVGPALFAAAATALGALVVASLAMAASLALGRTAIVLLVGVAIALIVAANTFGLAIAFVQPTETPGGFLVAVDRYGPPLFTAIVAGVAAWNPHVEPAAFYESAMLRLALWAVAGVALLLVQFRRREIEA